ncbi:hypothetical protein DL768_007107 [Monosporascus sp. mg162]|nr:hypothetical protein DL768_007107 [Monosporascus sp. mg162]
MQHRLARAAEPKPDDPSGTLSLLAFQSELARAVVVKEALAIPLEPASGGWRSGSSCPAWTVGILRKAAANEEHDLLMQTTKQRYMLQNDGVFRPAKAETVLRVLQVLQGGVFRGAALKNDPTNTNFDAPATVDNEQAYGHVSGGQAAEYPGDQERGSRKGKVAKGEQGRSGNA